MINLQDKKRNEYSDADLQQLEAALDDYWDRSRDLERHQSTILKSTYGSATAVL